MGVHCGLLGRHLLSVNWPGLEGIGVQQIEGVKMAAQYSSYKLTQQKLVNQTISYIKKRLPTFFTALLASLSAQNEASFFKANAQHLVGNSKWLVVYDVTSAIVLILARILMQAVVIRRCKVHVFQLAYTLVTLTTCHKIIYTSIN